MDKNCQKGSIGKGPSIKDVLKFRPLDMSSNDDTYNIQSAASTLYSTLPVCSRLNCGIPSPTIYIKENMDQGPLEDYLARG